MSLAWDFEANGAQEEKLFELLLVEFDDGWSEKLEVGLHYDLLIGKENLSPAESPSFIWSKKWVDVKFLWVAEKLQWNDPDYKRGENIWFSFLFNAGFLM